MSSMSGTVPKAWIWHTDSGLEVAEKLKLDLRGSLLTELWSQSLKASAGSTMLQTTISKLTYYDLCIIVLAPEDFTCQKEILGEMVKLGIGIGKYGVDRVFWVLPETHKTFMPDILDGHAPHSYTSLDDISNIAIAMKMMVRTIKPKPKTSPISHEAVIDILGSAVYAHYDDYQSVLTDVLQHLYLPAQFSTKTDVFLFKKIDSHFVEVGFSRHKKNKSFHVDDMTSFVAKAFKDQPQADSIFHDDDEMMYDGEMYVYCKPYESLGYVLTIHLIADQIITGEDLEKASASMVSNARIFKVVQTIIQGRGQYEEAKTPSLSKG
ncbi:MAG TPA: hypothetical protein VFV52_02525 [Bacilli bacterium]|nr:hypothetical protein [Bacilli bacterium]